jgi:hypothetical protein
MDSRLAESTYPITFRQEESKKLGEYLKHRQSVNIIGMKRVGINNFLRFFLNHREIVPTYISKEQHHLFIPVDLNDLVEREVYPFWTLTLKRIVDASESSSLPADIKEKINALFLTSIQSQDLFMVIDNVRHALRIITQQNVYPTLFLLRFDRLKDKFNPSLFDNLQGLHDAMEGRLAYVFTSYRSLDSLFPMVRTSLSVFAQQMYVKPASIGDMHSLYNTYKSKYDLDLSSQTENAFIDLVGGNYQYFQLGMIVLNEKKGKDLQTKDGLFAAMTADERITLESEELWDSLTGEEQKVLLQLVKKQQVTDEDTSRSKYLWDCGFVCNDTEKLCVFSALFENYVSHIEKDESKKTQIAHLTRKEHLLFTLLESHLGEICEREKIIEVVWPEYREFGVSDWAIDRLVARVRVKLKAQQSPYEIVTVRTRGYKLSTVKS